MEGLANKTKVELDVSDDRGRQISDSKKNSSNVSLFQTSTLSTSSGNKQRLANPTKYTAGRFQDGIGGRKDDRVRSFERRNQEIFQPGSNLYKQRRAKMHLERDMRWNGPHDEEFFRCFEQQLDIAIGRFVRQLKIQRKDEESPRRQVSVMLDEQRG